MQPRALALPSSCRGGAGATAARWLHGTPLMCAPRIMSVDRVPGVNMKNTGAPVREGMSGKAAAGAAALAAAVARQRTQRKLERQEAEVKSARLVAPPPTAGIRSTILSTLDAQIDGQPLAKEVVSRSLRRRAMGLDDAERPLRLLFAGPSGIGKTAMATALCESLLGSCLPDRNFKRFNLSEFSHPSKFNRLTGGDPNYVGYKEGGELTNFIRQAEERRAKLRSGVEHTSCVLLLDEVDRAADGLLTFLMNFLDQGQLTSGAGEMVDASRAVVLMTTNVGMATLKQTTAIPADAAPTAEATEAEAPWDGAASARQRVAIVDAIRNDVLREICDGRYENLGRLGTIVPFLPLSDRGRRGVVTRQFQHVAQRMAAAGARAELCGWSDAVMEHALAHWDDDIGGRSTRDFIEENVVEAIAEALDGTDAAEAFLSTERDRQRSPPRQLRLDAVEGRVVCDLS